MDHIVKKREMSLITAFSHGQPSMKTNSQEKKKGGPFPRIHLGSLYTLVLTGVIVWSMKDSEPLLAVAIFWLALLILIGPLISKWLSVPKGQSVKVPKYHVIALFNKLGFESFFKYGETVLMQEDKGHRIEQIDLREQFLALSIACETADNYPLSVEITVLWRLCWPPTQNSEGEPFYFCTSANPLKAMTMLVEISVQQRLRTLDYRTALKDLNQHLLQQLVLQLRPVARNYGIALQQAALISAHQIHHSSQEGINTQSEIHKLRQLNSVMNEVSDRTLDYALRSQNARNASN